MQRIALLTTALLLVLFTSTSCKKDEIRDSPNTPVRAQASGGEITVGDTTFAVNPIVVIDNWGPYDPNWWGPVHSGHEINIDIYEHLMDINPNFQFPLSSTVRGHSRVLQLTGYSNANSFEGVYTFQIDEPFPENSFSEGTYGTTKITSNSFSSHYHLNVVSGTFEIKRESNGLYTINLDLQSNNFSSPNDIVKIAGTINVEFLVSEFF
jgi:hypothetical protein